MLLQRKVAPELPRSPKLKEDAADKSDLQLLQASRATLAVSAWMAVAYNFRRWIGPW